MRELVRTIPEVVEAYTVTGEADGILRVRASDTGHFEKVLGRHPQPPRRDSGPGRPWCCPACDPMRTELWPARGMR